MRTWQRGDGPVLVRTESGAEYYVTSDGRAMRGSGQSDNTIEVDAWVWDITVGSVLHMVQRDNGHRITSTPVVSIVRQA